VTTRGRLLLRSDGGGEIGSGHLMRCLALGQAWRDAGGQARLLGQVPVAVAHRFRREHIEVLASATTPGSPEDATETIAAAADLAASWVVLDGYRFGGAFQRQLQASRLQLLCLDDHGYSDEYPAELVVNQNLHARAGDYPRTGGRTRLLLGPAYVLLRREFRAARRRDRDDTATRRVLVTFGGSDPRQLTVAVLRSLVPLVPDGLEIMVVIGPSNPCAEDLERTIAGMPDAVTAARDPADMPSLMDWADLAVTAAGSTCWELAFMGVPMVTITVADNQRPIAASIEAAGIGIDAGAWDTLQNGTIAAAVQRLRASVAVYKAMRARAQGLIDGRGPERLAAALARSAEAA
jgi:UDP-2,4-diacetamido-2,4,6-trideoxy-beta-L-altropyranose hydrolase